MKPYAQLLYDELFKVSQSLGVDTYAEKPMADVAYPFVYIRNVDLSFRQLKRVTYGTYRTNIEIFATERWQGNDIVDKLLLNMREIHTKQATFTVNMNTLNIREFEEQLDNQQTIHYFLIESEYRNL